LGIGQPAHEASYANLAGAAISFADSDWLDPLEKAVCGPVRSFIEQLLEEELEAALGRGRYERVADSNGRRRRPQPPELPAWADHPDGVSSYRAS
jgi:hypothetical protein